MVNKKDLRAGIEKMREVAELLSGWADDMESSLEKKAVGGGAVADGAAVPSFEELRGLLAKKSAAGCKAQVMALIRSYGVEKLSEVDPARYADLYQAAEGLGGDSAG